MSATMANLALAPSPHGRGLHLPSDLGARVRSVNARPGNDHLRGRVAAVVAFPVSHTFASLAPVKDQGQYGTCWDFATDGVMECLYLEAGEVISASEQFILNHNQDGYGCNGGDVAFDFLCTVGTATEASCPYLGCASHDTATPVYRIASWAFVGDSQSIPTDAAMKAALLTHGPLAVGVAAGSDWDNYRGGNSVLSGNGVVNHEVVIVGWDDGLGAWEVRNSWGISFGNGGYCWVKYGTGQIGTGAAFAVLVAPTPTPTPTPTPSPTPSPTPTPTPAPTPGPPDPAILAMLLRVVMTTVDNGRPWGLFNVASRVEYAVITALTKAWPR